MPGGLTRVTSTADSFVVSLQKGGGSKDVWVQSDKPVLPVTLLGSKHDRLSLSRGGSDLPSRVADDLFWLGRYVQRSESVARLARSVVSRSIEQGGESGRTLGVLTAALVGKSVEANPLAFERPLISFLFDPRFPGGLRGDIANVYRLARLLRDRVSLDALAHSPVRRNTHGRLQTRQRRTDWRAWRNCSTR
ncbi:MAG: alpha-E domain-containing protein [Tepidisphaeraceae bacterium]